MTNFATLMQKVDMHEIGFRHLARATTTLGQSCALNEQGMQALALLERFLADELDKNGVREALKRLRLTVTAYNEGTSEFFLTGALRGLQSGGGTRTARSLVLVARGISAEESAGRLLRLLQP